MITEPQQYHNGDNHKSITILREPQQYLNDNRTTTVSQ